MSIIRTMFNALVVISVLAFQSVSHAEAPEVQEGQPGIAGAVVESASSLFGAFSNSSTAQTVNQKELQCLARNIFYEAGSESEEGKVAVGLVTMNRLDDGRFGNSICGVVSQKSVVRVPKQLTYNRGTPLKKTTETVTVYVNATVCQFSWKCGAAKPIVHSDTRWVESQRVARELLEDHENYSTFRRKYASALYFHALHVKPAWAHQKILVSKIGGHRFYKDRPQAIAMR